MPSDAFLAPAMDVVRHHIWSRFAEQCQSVFVERYFMTFKNSAVNQPRARLWYLNILCFHFFFLSHLLLPFRLTGLEWTEAPDSRFPCASCHCWYSLSLSLSKWHLRVWKLREMRGVTDYCSRGIVLVKSRSSTSVFSLLTCKEIAIIKMVLYCSEKGRWHWRGALTNCLMYCLMSQDSGLSGTLDPGSRKIYTYQHSFGLSHFSTNQNICHQKNQSKDDKKKLKQKSKFCSGFLLILNLSEYKMCEEGLTTTGRY